MTYKRFTRQPLPNGGVVFPTFPTEPVGVLRWHAAGIDGKIVASGEIRVSPASSPADVTVTEE